VLAGNCYYRGYIEGVPGSAVTLSTCMGLRGLLQFHNATYGIEPLGSSPTFQHVVYPVGSGAAAGALLPHGHPGGRRDALAADSGSDAAQPDLKPRCIPVFQYRQLGDDQHIVPWRVAQLIGFLDSMFSSLNMTVTLSSMEVWRTRNKFQIAGAGEVVLLRFLDWKRSSTVLRPYEVPYLLMYRDQADFVGVTSPGTLCRSDLLGRSLGMGFDDGRGCRCPTRTCVMESAALRGLCCRCAPNTPCRPPADAQCDLPEFCNGSSASCPPDVYVQDGHSCEHSTGYCYQGHCQSAELQCQRLYGKGSAKNAPLACYEEINSHQDRFGHCGNRLLDGYQPCSWLNLGCGKLVCTYPNRVPFTKLKGAIIYAQVQEHLCVSFDVMHAPTEADPLLVKDGTKCGPGKVRNVSQAGKLEIFFVPLWHLQVCNNKKNCHCHPGWNPPHCRKQGSVVGGSTDSGQRLREMDSECPQRSPEQPRGSQHCLALTCCVVLSPDHAPKGSLKGTVKNALLLSFCLLIPILICIVILIMKWSRLMRRCAGSEMEAAA
uniref:ADAM metallopeptidase domain 32 n=1 Tax=Pavo cristatus TaxID=9049 RepID=A0A8C9LDQ9_PAVCR